MKKLMLFALAILLAFVFVEPVSAQNRGRRSYNGGYYGDSYAGSALQRSTQQTMGIVDGLFGEIGYGSRGRYSNPYDYRTGGGYNPGYGYGYGRGYSYGYDRGYGYYPYRGRHDTRNVLIGAGVIGGILAIDKIASHHDGSSDAKNEEASKCFERTVKAAKKQGVPVDPAQAMAFCSGQPLQQPAPDPMSERAAGNIEQDNTIMPMPAQEGFTPAPAPTATPHQFRGAFRENGILCNDSDRPLNVLINGRVVGTLAPGSYVTLSRLPAGQLSYHY
jgi:hypothetical protein